MRRGAASLATRHGQRIIGLLALLALAVSAALSLVISPPDARQGQLIRLMYVHVPAAWIAYLAFTVVFVASVAYLRTDRSRWDRLAGASAEIGVVFTAVTIVVGSIWAKPVWGTWWTWDPRLTTTAVLFLIYVGYLAIRRIPEDPRRRARWAAVVGIVGFVDVPIVHVSVRWWRSLHRPPARLLGIPDLAPAMGAALGAAVVAFSLAYVYLMLVRLRLERIEDRRITEAIAASVPGIDAAHEGVVLGG